MGHQLLMPERSRHNPRSLHLIVYTYAPHLNEYPYPTPLPPPSDNPEVKTSAHLCIRYEQALIISMRHPITQSPRSKSTGYDSISRALGTQAPCTPSISIIIIIIILPQCYSPTPGSFIISSLTEKLPEFRNKHPFSRSGFCSR